jgi:hypothetical protein
MVVWLAAQCDPGDDDMQNDIVFQAPGLFSATANGWFAVAALTIMTIAFLYFRRIK